MILLTVYIDKVTRRDRQQKLMTSQLSIDLYTLPVALCFASMFWLAKQNGATDSYVWFSVYYSVHKHSLKPQPTHHDNAMKELYCSHSREDYYRKTPSNIVRQYHVKCFEEFCTIFQTRKSVEVKFAYIS